MDTRRGPTRSTRVTSGGDSDSSTHRWVWWVLAVGAVAAATLMLSGRHARSWHFFADAARGLLDPGVYAQHPEFQFGPAAAVIAKAFLLGPTALIPWLPMAVGCVAGVATWWMITRASRWPSGSSASLRAGVVGALFLVPWVRLAAYSAHIDDVVALACTAGAVWAMTRNRPTRAMVCVALAVMVKPWAVVIAPILLAGKAPYRWHRLAGVAGLVLGSWLPYLVAPGTISALSGFGITVDPNSGLRALGLLDPATPGWLRPVQLGLGVLAATVAARRAGPAMAPLAGIGVRLALDPATHHYYTAGFVVVALLAELSLPELRWPWRTLVGATVLEVAAYDVGLAGFMAPLRFGMLTLAVCAACAQTRPAATKEPGVGADRRARRPLVDVLTAFS